MRQNKLLDGLRAGQPLLGLCNMYCDPGVIEGMCPGWDFVWIDAQHGQMTRDGVLNSIRAAEVVGVPAIVRVPDAGYGTLGLYADMAPAGIMIPMVDTPAQANEGVAGVRFPPLGKRSFGGLRAIQMDGRNYYHEREVLVIAQIETSLGVENAEAIAATEGIDALFFGGDDMKVQTGRSIDTSSFEDPALLKAMTQTADAFRKAGAFGGCVAGDDAAVRKAKELGYQLIVGGSDVGFVLSSARRRLPELRRVFDEGVARPPARPTPPLVHAYGERTNARRDAGNE